MKYADFNFLTMLKKPRAFYLPGVFYEGYKGRAPVKGGFGALEFLDKPV